MSDIYSETLSKLAPLLTFSISQDGNFVITLSDKDYIIGEVGLVHGCSSLPAIGDAFIEAARAAIGIMTDDDILCEDWPAECVSDLIAEAGLDLDIQVQAFFACRPWLKQAFK